MSEESHLQYTATVDEMNFDTDGADVSVTTGRGDIYEGQPRGAARIRIPRIVAIDNLEPGDLVRVSITVLDRVTGRSRPVNLKERRPAKVEVD